MTTVFAVVGQHLEDPDRFLLLGSDGRHFDMELPDGAPLPCDPDERWAIDDHTPDPTEVTE